MTQYRPAMSDFVDINDEGGKWVRILKASSFEAFCPSLLDLFDLIQIRVVLDADHWGCLQTIKLFLQI